MTPDQAADTVAAFVVLIPAAILALMLVAKAVMTLVDG